MTLSAQASVWRVELDFGKAQPRCDAWTTGDLFIAVETAREIAVTGRIVGDDFEPIPVTLYINTSPTHRPMIREDVENAARDF